MASPKVANAQFRVGLLAIIAMAILGAMIFLLTGSSPLFRDQVPIQTYFRDSASMAVGSPVRLNGFVIGKVTKVELTGSADPLRRVKVSMNVDDKYLSYMPVDSKAEISAENLLGSKQINIKSGVEKATIQPGGTVQALSTREFAELLDQGYGMAATANELIARINSIVKDIESGEGNIGKFLRDEKLYTSLLASINEIQKLTKALNSPDSTLGKLIYSHEIYDDLRQTMGRIDGIVATIERGEGTAGKLLKDPAVYDETRRSIVEVKTLLADLNAGKGTAGKLLKDDQLANQLNATLTKLNGTIDKLNQGQGTLGQLLVNPQLYDNLNGLTVEMNSFMKDFRKNPKKFLSIKLGLF